MGSLGTVDWVIFGCVIAVPLLLTLGLGVLKGGTSTNTAFILGNRNLSILPVALSLAVSYLSAVTISGVPGEVSYYGTLFPWTFLVAITFALLILPNIFIPVFHKMYLTSVYEYLEARYSSRLMRWLGSSTFLLTITLYLGVALYAPCVSMSLMTGGPVWCFILAGGVLSVLVTGFGGLRTVVWTDAWQATIMIAGLVSMVVLGVTGEEGVAGGWQSALDRGRIKLADWTADPTQRSSSLIIFFGQFVQWGTIYSCHQTQVQRYCSVKSVSTARWSLAINVIVVWVINVGAVLSGLVIFAHFKDCDPLDHGDIKKTDQLATHYVLDVLTEVPGLAGLFLAALVSGALSSVSSGLNSLASVLWEDFVAHSAWAHQAKDNTKVRVTRGFAVSFGLIATGLSLGFSNLDGVLKVATTSIGMLSGPLLSVFILGYFFSFVNKVGGIVGILVGHAVTIWIASGALFLTKGARRPTLETSVAGCQDDFRQIQTNITSTPDTEFRLEEVSGMEYLYQFSPFLYPVIGFVVTSVVGLVVSLVTLACWRPRPPPHLLLHPWARGKGAAPPTRQDDGRWDEHDSHFRWPSPSLPPTLKKPRPGDTFRLGASKGGGRSRSGFINGFETRTANQQGSGFISGFENNSYDDWSEVGTNKRSIGWSTLRSGKGATDKDDKLYNSRL